MGESSMSMKTTPKTMVMVWVITTLSLVLAACAGNASYNQATPTLLSSNITVPPGEHALFVSYNQTLKENILTDEKGDTLYYHSTDPGDGSLCLEACKAIWNPLASAGGHPVISDPSITGKVSTVKLSTGVLQVTYNGKPLYIFTLTTHVGDLSGNGYENQWFVVTP